jgi:hypothetical protein
MGKPFPRFHTGLAGLVLACLFLGGAVAEAVTVNVIGQIESIYMQRAAMRVIEVPGDASGTSALKPGQKVSFMLPSHVKKLKGKEAIEYGKVVEATLEGNQITEYNNNAAAPDTMEAPAPTGDQVYVWSASRISKVRNQRKYLPESEDKKGGKKGKKDRKNKEPERIWTQEETVRGTVFVKDNRIYIKEDQLRPRDRGLDVTSADWDEKLKPLSGKIVIVNGTTRRVSLSSGTIDINNLIKVYPK